MAHFVVYGFVSAFALSLLVGALAIRTAADDFFFFGATGRSPKALQLISSLRTRSLRLAGNSNDALRRTLEVDVRSQPYGDRRLLPGRAPKKNAGSLEG
jgi:hypothetical protein